MNPSVLIFARCPEVPSNFISISRIDIINMLIQCANLCACQRFAERNKQTLSVYLSLLPLGNVQIKRKWERAQKPPHETKQ